MTFIGFWAKRKAQERNSPKSVLIFFMFFVVYTIKIADPRIFPSKIFIPGIYPLREPGVFLFF
jgi:hypothetical protein